jgi:catechol 2,3-dioxygenase-like lactoylglutathione lyase family enzyme
MTNLNYVSPCFIVSNIKKSLSFYVERLGFELHYLGPDDNPFFAIVGRDRVSIMLKAITEEIKPVPNHTRHEWARLDAYISTADPDRLFEEYSKAGLSFHRAIGDDDDGLRGFEVKDADGYVLFFGRPKVFVATTSMRVVPLLKVSNMHVALWHYTGVLDFRMTDPADSAESGVVDLGHEYLQLQLTTYEGKDLFGSVVNLLVDNVDSLFAKYKSRGLNTSGKKDSPVHQGPVDQTWGRREFYVTDSDGNTLRFCQPIP